MATAKSPPLAFEPAPETILPDMNNKENLSPSNGIKKPFLTNGLGHDQDHLLREVHFSPMGTPTRRAQSLATDVPLLEPIGSASQLPRQSARARHTTSIISLDAYVEQSRSLLESQRKHFEQERSFFDQERKLWDSERSLLKAQIADLELRLQRATGLPSSGRSQGQDTTTRGHFDSIRASVTFNRDSSNDAPSPSDHRIWEGPGGSGTVTRVFSNESYGTRRSEGYLPSIVESPSALQRKDDHTSPLTNKTEHKQSISIPIEKIDSSLDGITIKSTGLPPSVVKTLVPTISEPESPSKTPSSARSPKDMHLALSPFPENLIKDAGHTPMAKEEPASGNINTIVDKISNESSPPLDPQNPYSPGPTLRPPTERSNSYFPVPEEIEEGAAEPDEDVELKGPLCMKPEGQDNAFLCALDQKLEAEAHKAESSDAENKSDRGLPKDIEKVKSSDPDDDEGPTLRIKKSMNFGGAWGTTNLGRNV